MDFIRFFIEADYFNRKWIELISAKTRLASCKIIKQYWIRLMYD